MRWILMSVALAAGASEARAEGVWRASGGVEAYTAPVLPGVVVSAALEASRVLQGPWSAGLRVSGGSATEANEFWKLQQTHLTLLAGGTYGHAIGAGTLTGTLEFGLLAIREDATRHQYERLTQAGIEDRERIAWSAGPMARLRLGADVEFAEGWGLTVQVGPQLTAMNVNGAWSVGTGLFSTLGVRHAF